MVKNPWDSNPFLNPSGTLTLAAMPAGAFAYPESVLPQAKINERNADDNPLFGDSAKASKRLYDLETSGLGRSFISGRGAYRNSADVDKDEEEEKEKRRLQLLLAGLDADISAIENTLSDYLNRLKELGRNLDKSFASYDMYSGIRDRLNQHASYGDFLKSVYGGSLSGGNLNTTLAALQNPLTDAQGNPVYSSANHLYRLETDASGNIVYDSETGQPNRIFYTDQAEIDDLMKQALDKDAPKPFAEYTSASRDPMNMRMMEWVDVPVNVDPRAEALLSGYQANKLAAEGANPNLALTIKPSTKEGLLEICDERQCQLVEKIKGISAEMKDIGAKAEAEGEKLDGIGKKYSAAGGDGTKATASARGLLGEISETIKASDKRLKDEFASMAAPAPAYDPAAAKLESDIMAQVENGKISGEKLDHLLENASPEMKARMMSKLDQRGCEVVRPENQIAQNLPQIFGGNGFQQDISDAKMDKIVKNPIGGLSSAWMQDREMDKNSGPSVMNNAFASAAIGNKPDMAPKPVTPDMDMTNDLTNAPKLIMPGAMG